MAQLAEILKLRATFDMSSKALKKFPSSMHSVRPVRVKLENLARIADPVLTLTFLMPNFSPQK
jgi:hypothetical protein